MPQQRSRRKFLKFYRRVLGQEKFAAEAGPARQNPLFYYCNYNYFLSFRILEQIEGRKAPNSPCKPLQESPLQFPDKLRTHSAGSPAKSARGIPRTGSRQAELASPRSRQNHPRFRSPQPPVKKENVEPRSVGGGGGSNRSTPVKPKIEPKSEPAKPPIPSPRALVAKRRSRQIQTCENFSVC